MRVIGDVVPYVIRGEPLADFKGHELGGILWKRNRRRNQVQIGHGV